MLLTILRMPGSHTLLRLISFEICFNLGDSVYSCRNPSCLVWGELCHSHHRGSLSSPHTTGICQGHVGRPPEQEMWLWLCPRARVGHTQCSLSCVGGKEWELPSGSRETWIGVELRE